MKSNTTMLSLARARAYANEVQEIAINNDISIVGYAITFKDLAMLYKENGFTSPDVSRRHLSIWKTIGAVKTYYNDVIIVFVPQATDAEQLTNLTLIQKERGSSVIAVLPKEAVA